MAVRAVIFDVGETLVDETEMWERYADAAGVARFTLMGVLGGLAARRADHREVWGVLGIEQPRPPWRPLPFYPDALACLARLRGLGLLVGAAGNSTTAAEDELRPHVDVVGSAQGWGVGKPEPAFFERVVGLTPFAPHEIAYVGDRVDYDVEPALAAGLVAVHLRRGPWGLLHETPPGVVSIRSLDELPRGLDA